MNSHLGNGMVGAKRVKYSTILEVADILGLSVYDLALRFGKAQAFFSESAHVRRRGLVPRSAERFFRAVRNGEALPPSESRITYSNIKSLLKRRHMKVKDFASYIGYSGGQSLQKHTKFNAGEALLAIDFLECTYEELIATKYVAKSSAKQIEICEIIDDAYEAKEVKKEPDLVSVLNLIAQRLSEIHSSLIEIDKSLISIDRNLV